MDLAINHEEFSVPQKMMAKEVNSGIYPRIFIVINGDSLAIHIVIYIDRTCLIVIHLDLQSR
jgi:hypothetical protein